jgi:1-deoxy-D-xylulose-5-phosphate synthase
MKRELTQYNFPEDLKTMSDDELELLAYAIRDFLVEKVSVTGGHLASNLGVVELTIALHRVFNCPEDKIIWDVGHQSYVHKILTGRAAGFDTLRQTGGMSGFPKSRDSIYDAYDTGHSSTSLSAAAGMAAARDIRHEYNQVVAVIGDGSLTGGMAYEALNNIGASKSKVIIILNDNGMSISKNIGGVSHHLGKLRTSDKYLNAKKHLKNALNSIPVVGKGIESGLSGAKDWLKYAMVSGGVLFEELGITYLGPVDGHDIQAMIEVMEQAEHVRGPVIIHVITKKGKGYINAEKDPNKFHGIGPFDPETGTPKSPSGTTYSKIMGRTLVELGERDDRIVAITAAMGTATGLGDFAESFPRRYFDTGIAEAHAVTFAAGLAKAGMKPLVAIYSSFLQRGYDQIVEDVCIQGLPVVFAIDRAGIVGADGETHHGLFDISYLSSIPGITILTPANGNQLAAMMEYAFEQPGPVAIRYPRGGCGFDPDAVEVFDGRSLRLFSGTDVDIWACGAMLDKALTARELLRKRGISAGIVDVRVVKPLDMSAMSSRCRNIVTLEDGVVMGGFGEKLRAIVPASITVMNLGWPDRYIEHGSCDDLYRKYGLDGASIAERISERFEGKA